MVVAQHSAETLAAVISPSRMPTTTQAGCGRFKIRWAGSGKTTYSIWPRIDVNGIFGSHGYVPRRGLLPGRVSK